jgi:predicted ATPase/class 3 adenylate cyclase
LAEVSFGEWLKRRRRALDLTQEQFAQQINCSTSTLRKIETEERRPSEQMVRQLAEAFNIAPNERAIFLKFARGRLEAALAGTIEDVPWRDSPPSANQSELKTRLSTFLFTDIEDSTKLWESAPEQMKVALERHHSILEEAISSNGGEVFQIVGDAFCSVFPTALSAISAAVKAQYGLYQEPWGLPFPIRVRMSIHTGEAQRASDHALTGGYTSNQTLNRVTRILKAGHGGQVLLSRAAQEFVEDSLPVETALRDIGEHHLKNLIQPEHLFQLTIEGLPSKFPPLNTLESVRHNLPFQLTSFIGREQEQAEILKLINKHRLVTLAGSGGVGKTRLSLKVGEQVIGNYADGVWFVEFAPILDPQLVPSIIAIALNLRDAPQRPAMDTLSDYLREKRMLIILDNCEHLIEACAELADTLLKRCSSLKLLATSREALDLPGEAVYRVPSLELPDFQQLLETFRDYESVRLFEERAQLAQTDFSLTMENASSVAKICNRLDGIPLAIELAAARVRMFSTEQIATRLKESFSLLVTGNRRVLPRHQTLQAAIDWSYELLSPLEQTLLQRLSVFVNGWTLEAAEFVCADAKIKPENVLDLLTQLFNKSLINSEESREEPPDPSWDSFRYRMLEMIREYAFKKLTTSDEMRAISLRHLMFFAEMVNDAESKFKGPDQALWYNRLDKELDNLRVALTSFEGSENVEVRLRIHTGLWRYWKSRGHSSEGRRYLHSVLAGIPPGPTRKTAAFAKALTAAGSLAYYEGDFSYSEQSRNEALAIFRNVEDKTGIADCLIGLGNTAMSQGNFEAAEAFYEEGLLIRKELNDKWGIARLLGNLGLLTYFQADFNQARSLHLESLALFRELRDDESVANELVNLGDVERFQGDLSTANAFYEEGFSISRKSKDQWGLAYAIMGLADVAFEQEDLTRASTLYRECLLLFQRGTDYVGLPFALESVAGLACIRNQLERAARILGAADALRKNTHLPLPLPYKSAHQKRISVIREQLAPSLFDFAWAEGQAMTMGQAIDYALENLG